MFGLGIGRGMRRGMRQGREFEIAIRGRLVGAADGRRRQRQAGRRTFAGNGRRWDAAAAADAGAEGAVRQVGAW